MPASIEDAREDEREEVFMVVAIEVGGGAMAGKQRAFRSWRY
jgi:hypothetical protein